MNRLKIKQKLGKVHCVLKKEGISSLLRKLFSKYIYREWVLVCLRLDFSKPIKTYRRKRKWRIEFLCEANLNACQRYFYRYIPVYKRLLKEGLVGTVGIVENDVVSIFWISKQTYYDSDYYKCTFEVPAGELYQFAGEVAKPYRNTTVVLDTQIYAWEFLKKQGYTGTNGAIDDKNKGSLKVHFHLGFEETKQLIIVRKLLGVQWCRSVFYPINRHDYLNKFRRKR
jgi:hypothetical protein